MTQILDLSNEDIKVAIITMLNDVKVTTLETNEKIKVFSRQIKLK